MVHMIRKFIIALMFLTAGSAGAADIASSTTTMTSPASAMAADQVCEESAQTPCPPSTNWEQELERAKSSWGACESDIQTFCEGIQVGEGRIEKCLKAHRRKLSKECRKAQSL